MTSRRIGSICNSTTTTWICFVCSWIGLLGSILAVTSCSFVVVVQQQVEEGDHHEVIRKASVGPLRSYDATSHTCPILLSSWNMSNPSLDVFSYIVLCMIAILSIVGVVFGAMAVFSLPTTIIPQPPSNTVVAPVLSWICKRTTNSSFANNINNNNNNPRRIYLLFLGTCTCQILTLGMFFSNFFQNTTSTSTTSSITITLGWGAILSIISIALFITTIISFALLSKTSMTNNQNNHYYAFFDVDYMEAFPSSTNTNTNPSLTMPLIIDNTTTYDAQSNYGNLPPWVHTIQ
jgi:hypothetical protein